MQRRDHAAVGRLLLDEAVSQIGLTVSAHDNGTTALEAAQQNNPAIVLLDVDMPGMGGQDMAAMAAYFKTEAAAFTAAPIHSVGWRVRIT